MAEDIGNIQTIAGVEILTTNQLCKYLGLSRTRLYTIRNTDTSFPLPFTFTGDKGDLKWKLEDVKNWALSKMENSDENG
jgi:predicted DNA-binding transcriptional regulator AlpA